MTNMQEPLSVPVVLEAVRQWEAQSHVLMEEELQVLRRVVANESNHYDRYWSPPPERITLEWLDESEAKWREALTDVYCDDAAACFLTIAQELRRAWADLAQR